MTLSLPAQTAHSARLSIERIDFADELGPLKNLSVSCRNPVVKPPVFACSGAVSGTLGRLGRQRFTADVSYNTEKEVLSFRIRDLKLADGGVELQGRWLPSGWQITAQGKTLSLSALAKLASPWFSLPQDLTVNGRTTLQLTARGGEALETLDATLSVEQLTANNAAGTFATDTLAFELETQVRAAAADWNITATLRSNKGQAYSDPIFIDFAQNALQAQHAGRWQTDKNLLRIETLTLDQQGIAAGRLTGQLNFAAGPLVKTAQLQLDALRFPGAYTALLQPFLLNTDFKDLKTTGQISGTVAIADNAPTTLDLTLDNVIADDKAGKLGIHGLRGHVVWRSTAVAAAATAARQTTSQPVDGAASEPASQISWEKANAYGLSGGAARIAFVTSGTDFRVLEPTLIPILDGGLAIQSLNVHAFGSEAMSLRFEAQLKPISMPLLCKAFDWPEFSGTVSGRIPQVSYDKHVLSVGGALEAEAFGGRLTVDALKLRNPLSDYPRLNADVKMRNLDLQAVTGTFSFGTITGLLDGEINNLELFRWSPVRMDLRLYTSPNDKSRHLISQRAVNDLSNIGGGGGGVTAALSSGFLRFFENFRYERLGLSCRLENEVCNMNGVARAAGDSYYIVKGNGIPRIDIIGNARRVNWPQLLEQIKAIQASEGPVVK